MKEWVRNQLGRAEFPDPKAFRYIRTHFLEEPARFRVAQFWSAAEAIATLPNRKLIEGLPQAYAHSLRCMMDEISAAGRQTGPRWHKVSRSVVQAKNRYVQAAAATTEGEDEALRELLELIDDMALFHDNEAPQDVRNLTNLIYEKTGARVVGMDQDPVEEFKEVKCALAKMAHSSGTWEQATVLRERAVSVLLRLFRPPEESLDAIRTLALSPPTAETLVALEDSITNENQLRFFVQEIEEPSWILALGQSEIFVPSPHGGAWPAVLAIERFGQGFQDELRQWLSDCYDHWQTRESTPAAIAAGARALGQAGNDLLLRILKDHQTDPSVRWHALTALDRTDPSDQFTTEVAEILLLVEEDTK